MLAGNNGWARRPPDPGVARVAEPVATSELAQIAADLAHWRQAARPPAELEKIGAPGPSGALQSYLCSWGGRLLTAASQHRARETRRRGCARYSGSRHPRCAYDGVERRARRSPG